MTFPGPDGESPTEGHESGAAAAAPPPGWFRGVVWESLLGGLCPLFPLPFVDDWALSRVRRKMVRGLCAKRGVTPTRRQLRRLAGGRSGFSCLGLLVKGTIYPFRKLLRKILYFLAVKEGVDTFSLLFHQGYLLHSALLAGALGDAGTPSDGAVDRVGSSIFGTLDACDTRPVEGLVRGVFRHSRRLVRSMVRWVTTSLGRKSLESLQIEGRDRDKLAADSPETEALLDRLLSVLWGEEDYLRGLDEELSRRLAAAATAAGTAT